MIPIMALKVVGGFFSKVESILDYKIENFQGLSIQKTLNCKKRNSSIRKVIRFFQSKKYDYNMLGNMKYTYTQKMTTEVV